MRFTLVYSLLFLGSLANAAEILTNFIHFPDAPAWLTERTVDTASTRVQNFLEWDVRRIKAYYYSDRAKFESVHGLGPSVRAFFRRNDSTVHLGPDVNAENFDAIFGHEVVHVIFYQKYKEAIPAWLEEGLANYVGRTSKVDYAWLGAQKIPDVKSLKHPFKDSSGSKLHYSMSTALIEMIAAKCSLHDLLHLSVGRSLENYLSTLCEFRDLNASFREWLDRKRKEAIPATPLAKKKSPVK